MRVAALMRRLIILLAAALVATLFVGATIAQSAPNMFTQPGYSIIGVGCTTSVYIDQGCKPCGVGMKSGGVYPNAAYPWGTYPSPYTPSSPPIPNTAAWYTMGDSPDPDPTDPTLGCSSAAWEARYGWIYATPTTSGQAATDNAAMVAFLISRKGYSNLGWGCTGTTCATPAVYYISQSGTDSTCESGSTAIPNRPDIPCLSTIPIENALKTLVSSFSAQGYITNGSNILTITSASCTGTLTFNMNVTGTGLAANDFFILGQATSTMSGGTQGCGGTYYLQKAVTATEPIETITGKNFPGGVVIVEAGTWAPCAVPYTSGECLRFTGSDLPAFTGTVGYPIYVLAFPGAVVTQENETGQGYQNNQSDPPICCITWDGIQFLDPNFDSESTGGSQGNALSYNNSAYITIINNEFAGWDKIFFGNNSYKTLVANNVFHEMYAHSIYYAAGSRTSCIASGILGADAGDVDFALNQQMYFAGTGCGAHYAPRILGNVIYDGGAVGYDSIHLNSYVDAPVVSGNIISYVGGAPLGFQTGVYNALATANLMFDHGDNCWIPYLGPPNVSSGSPASMRRNTFTNNLCWSGATSDNIWGVNPDGGIYQFSDQQFNMTATWTTGSDILTIVEAGGPTVGNFWVISNATGIPTSTALVGPTVCGSCTGNGGNGTYQMTANATVTQSSAVAITLSNPPSISLSDTTITSNIIVQNNNGATAELPLQFYWQSFPETDTITGNKFWSTGSSTTQAMYVISGAGAGSVPAGTYAFSGGSGCNPSTGSFSACFPGNTYGDPGFQAASTSYTTTPGAFNFKSSVIAGCCNLH